MRRLIDKNKLKSLVKEGLTQKQIALKMGFTISSIRRKMRKLKIKTKNAIHCNSDGSFKKIISRRVISKQELNELYVNQQLSTRDIARIKNCSKTAILAWLNKYKIKTRDGSSSKKVMYKFKKNVGFQKGSKNPAYGKSSGGSEYRGKRVRYKQITFRSTYEAKYAQWLDSKDLDWIYEPKRFDLSGERTYLPDFYVEGIGYVEIKGWMTPEALERIEEFKKSNNLKVLYKKDLEALGVL